MPEDNGPTFNNQPATNTLSAFNTEPSITVLAPGETQVFTATYELSQIDLDNIAAAANSETAANNTASVFGEPENGVLEPVTPSPAVTGVATSPSIELIKTSVAPNPAVVGANITYTFTLENTGNVSITNPTVSDPVCQSPVGDLSFTNGFDNGDTGAQAGVLDVAEEWVFSCTTALTQIQIDAGNVVNTANATGLDPAGVPISDESNSGNPGDAGGAITNTPLVRTPSFTVLKSTNSVPVNAGDTLTYDFVLNNTGNVTISAPVVSDVKCAVPAGVASLNAGDVNGDGNLAPNETFIYSCTSIPVTQIEVDDANVPNSVTVTGTPPAGTALQPAIATVNTPVAPTPSLTVVKSASAPTQLVGGSTSPGDIIPYSYVVLNTGNVTLTSIGINDAGPSFNGIPGGSTLGPVTCSPAILAPTTQSACSVNYVLTQNDIDNAIAGGINSVSNTATASGTPPDVNGNPGAPISSTSSTATTTVQPASNIELVKTVVVDSITIALGAVNSITDVGDTISYNLAVTNTGNTTLSQIVVADSITNDIVCPNSGDNTIASIAVGGPVVNCTAVFTLTQDNITAGSVTNQASVSANDPSGSAINADDTITTALPQTPLVSLIKSVAAPSTLNADGSFNQAFNFTLSNVGNVALSNAEIVDDLVGQFGACFVSVVSPGTVSINDVAPANDSSGEVVGTLTNIASIAVLGVGDSIVLSDFTAQFNQQAVGCVFPDPAENSASATGTFAGLPPATDISDNTDDPTSGVPNNAGSPTPFTPLLPAPELGLAKAAQVLAFNADTTFEVEFTMLLQNTGDVNVSNLSLFDDINTQYGAAFITSDATTTTSGIISAPVVTLLTDAEPLLDTVLPLANDGYDGGAIESMITVSPSSVLGVGDVIQVVFTISANPSLLARPLEDFENVASTSGTAPNGDQVEDQSNSGSDPETGSGGSADPTIVTLADISSLPITLGQLSSERISQNTIQINWQTQTEVANLGFNIYGRIDGQWQLLNSEVIPAKGDSVQIVDYQLLVNSSAEQLALSDIDGNGVETLHGPFVVGQVYGTQAQRQNTDWSEAIKRRDQKQALRNEDRRKQMIERNLQRKQKRNARGQ